MVFRFHADCLVTGTDGSVYPTPHSFISYFDVHSPELSLVFSESLVVGSVVDLVLETSEPVTLLEFVDTIAVTGGKLLGLASISKTLFPHRLPFTRRFVAEATVNSTFQMTIPRSAVRDLAGNTMTSDFSISLTPGTFCDLLFPEWKRPT